MPQREPALRWLRDFALTALVLALCTLTSWVFFRLDFVSSNYILTYILGVMYINVFTSGLVYGVVASLFSVMLVNYTFIDPFMQFRIRSDDMVTAVVMLCVSLLCSSLTGRIKVQAAQSERKAYASQVLLEASRSLLGAEDPDTILRITATQLGKLLERPVCFAPAPEHIAPGTLILPPPAQTDYRSCPALHEFSTYEHNLALSILDVCSLALEKEASNRARREIEEAARQEQLRANLLRSISHDLRTPLTSISGNALILTEKNPLLTEEKRRELSAAIYEDANWLNHLVENLLSITRMENGQVNLHIQPELIQDIFDDVLTHLDHDAACHTIVTNVADDLLMADMDAQLIEQVLVNLINNAINYTSKEDKQVFLRQINQPDCVRIEVRDTGDGIEEDKIKLIFDKYYRSENHKREVVGTGLGLSIVKAILKLHNYDYGVNSKLGEGSTFWFAIRTDQQPSPEATPAIAPTESKKGVDHAKSE